MRGLSRVVLVGRLGADPELRQAKNGSVWGRMSVATNRGRKEGEAWVEETDWHDVKMFGDIADRCHRFLKVGSVVAVEGALVYDTWVDEQNVKHRKARVVASRVSFVSDLRRPPEAGAVDNGHDDGGEATLELPA